MRRPVSSGMRYAPSERRARGAKKRRPAMKKISTVEIERIQIFKENQLTIGLDLGDRTSHYCILNEAGEVIFEHELPTTPKGIVPLRRTELYAHLSLNPLLEGE